MKGGFPALAVAVMTSEDPPDISTIALVRFKAVDLEKSRAPHISAHHK